MKYILSILFCLFVENSLANMASPISKGTVMASAISSRDIDVLSETIHIQIDSCFHFIHFVIEYHIRAEQRGRQVPLLFCAMDYYNFNNNFIVTLDSIPVDLLDFPKDYTSDSMQRVFNGFCYWPNDYEEMVSIQWEQGRKEYYPLNDLKYFEADIDAGEHLIRIEYLANPWVNKGKWVNTYNVNYSLAPAKHWRSFGKLEIILDATALKIADSSLTTNLGSPISGKVDSVAIWRFSKIPEDNILLSYYPSIGDFAQIMISIEPEGLGMIIAVILSVILLYITSKLKKQQPEKKFTWIIVVGSLVNMFLILLSVILSYPLIDSIIGSYASKYHGYYVLWILFYPIFLAAYLPIMLFINKLHSLYYYKIKPMRS